MHSSDGTGHADRIARGISGPYRTIESSVVVDAPIDVVWDVTTDPANFPNAIDWVYEAWWETDGPLEVGSVYLERAKPGLRKDIYRWEILACEKHHRNVHYHRSGELEAELELRYEPMGGERTRYTQTLRFRALPAFRPLGYVLERTVMPRRMKRDFDRTILPNYKRLCEERVRRTVA